VGVRAAGDAGGLAEQLRLLQAVLSGRRIDDEQHLVRLQRREHEHVRPHRARHLGQRGRESLSTLGLDAQPEPMRS